MTPLSLTRFWVQLFENSKWGFAFETLLTLYQKKKKWSSYNKRKTGAILSPRALTTNTNNNQATNVMYSRTTRNYGWAAGASNDGCILYMPGTPGTGSPHPKNNYYLLQELEWIVPPPIGTCVAVVVPNSMVDD